MRGIPIVVSMVLAFVAIAGLPDEALAKCGSGSSVLPGIVLIVDGVVVGEYQTPSQADMPLDSAEIVTAAANGDQSCQQMLDCYYDQMARSLAHLINIVDPDAIVLGGGMSNIDAIYPAVAARLGDYVFSDFVATPILKAARGDSSGVYGAALLWE